MFSKLPPRPHQQASFTLFETIVALGIMATMLVEVASVQGNTIYFSEYAQNMTQGIWLAKDVMSQVEYNSSQMDFSEIKEVEHPDVPFEDFPGFKYSLSIKTWKLPIVEMLSSGGVARGEDGEDSSEEKPKDDSGSMIEQGIKQILGDELLKVAHVKVSWPEGAKSNDVTLTYLLTNQKKLDEAISGMKASYEKLTKGAGGTPPPPAQPADGSGGAGGAPSDSGGGGSGGGSDDPARPRPPTEEDQ